MRSTCRVGLEWRRRTKSAGDGEVNNGSELFGALSGDGYADLDAIDDDGNGWIDAADAATNQLYLWLAEAGGSG